MPDQLGIPDDGHRDVHEAVEDEEDPDGLVADPDKGFAVRDLTDVDARGEVRAGGRRQRGEQRMAVDLDPPGRDAGRAVPRDERILRVLDGRVEVREPPHPPVARRRAAAG